MRLDHIVNEPLFRRHKRVRKPLAKISHSLPIHRTAISAVGYARLISVRRCFEPIMRKAPSYALRVMMVTFGPVA